MSVLNLKTTALALVAGASLAGCAYGPYGGLGAGVGYSNGSYDPYYNGGYYNGGGYYGAGYGSPYGYGYPYNGYGYGYGSPYYGWYDGQYYPGTGYYVYDSHRNRHRWTDAQRRYWERQRGVATSRGGVAGIVENWADFQNGPRANNAVRQQSVERQRILRGQPTTQQPAQTSQPQRRTGRTVVQQEQGRRGFGGGRKRHTQED
ncbi:MAG TPA: hypothetical protein VFH89_06210 [Sphingomicrobium sp.]|nr:hypothetical protein [Sphingomicrobium sp.]